MTHDAYKLIYEWWGRIKVMHVGVQLATVKIKEKREAPISHLWKSTRHRREMTNKII
jgi:hypothetical protein